MEIATGSVINAIRSKFYTELESKTGWGRNELKATFDTIVMNVMSEHINNLEELNKKPYEDKDYVPITGKL